MQATVDGVGRGSEGIPNGFGGDPLGIVERFVRVIGRHTEGLFDYHDFGFSRCVVHDHIARVADGLASLRAASNRPVMDLRAVDRERSIRTSPWDHRQSFRYAAGASMVLECFRGAVRLEDMPRAYAAIALHEFQVDLLDDFVDAAPYSEDEAAALYRHCLAPITADALDRHQFRRQMRRLVKPGQEPGVELMASITGQLHQILRSAPNWRSIAPSLAATNEVLASGQALTMHQQTPTVDLRALRRGAACLPGPDADLTWQERLACAASHGTNLVLIELCFARERLSEKTLAAHLKAWAYYNLLITHMNNLADVSKDTAAGLVNIAVLWMKEPEVLDAKDIRTEPPTLTLSDYEAFLSRTAYLARRALRAGRATGDDTDLFYPFITLMIPAVMLYEPGGSGEDLLHTFLRFLAPMVRRELARDDPFA